MEQKEGLIDTRKFYNEIAESQVQQAFQECIQKTKTFLPDGNYTDHQREELCHFIIENRDKLINNGYKDTRDFLKMFSEMLKQRINSQTISHDNAFKLVMNASARLVQ
ncbi:MAG: hypothetical protein ACR2M6_00745 [Vampirovibrionia bacterium]